MTQLRSLQVSNSGFEDVNGFYTEIKENVFEMKRSDNNRIYQIAIDKSTPFACNVWSIKRIDCFNEVCIYINTNKNMLDDIDDNNNGWQSVVGSIPYPNIKTVVGSISNRNDQEKFVETENNKRKNWKKGDVLLFWSRNKNNWIKGKILQINDGFVYIQTYYDRNNQDDDEKKTDKENKQENYEKIWIEINSELLQSDIDENFYKRKLKKTNSECME